MGEIKKIVKRDGRKQKFDRNKIVEAIYKAAESAGGSDHELAEKLADKVVNYINEKYEGNEPTVENIQDAVEYILIEEGHAQTAKKYILYRNERATKREMGGNLMKTLYDITFQDANDNDVKRENANVNADTAMGTMLKYGSESAKRFYQLMVLKPEHAKAHAEGDIHIHDLDFYALTTTCCQIDLIKLFKDGFCTGEGFLREPNSIASYAALACIAIQSNQNDQHGGQSIPNFEYAMAEGVKKSYTKAYRRNLITGLELLSGKDDCEDEIREMMYNILDTKKLEPVLEQYNDYQKYEIEELEDGDTREVLRLKPYLAPYKCAVLPLTNKLNEQASELQAMLSKEFTCDYDVSGKIGKRYRRQDAMGTPFCVTYDFDSLEDGCVTIRDRDTMAQERIKIEEVADYINKRLKY